MDDREHHPGGRGRVGSRLVYLDNHATTRCDPLVVEAMLPYFSEIYGNAGSRTHSFGLEAGAAVEHARAQIARWIGASPKEIVLTSGATEADNLAILGVVAGSRKRHVVTVATEHRAVLDACAAVTRAGGTVDLVPVGSDGLVDPADVAKAIRPDTALVSVMAVNNEIGVIQALAEIGAVCRERGVWLHTDAAQAGAAVPIDVATLPVDMLSLSAHKVYGPKGIGALWVRRGRPRIPLEAQIHGGGQERGFRSGTLPVPLVVGFGKAADLAREGLAADEPARLAGLRDRLLEGLRAGIADLTVNGSLAHRHPGNLNVSLAGVEAQALMMSARDVAVSSGSACSSATLEPSHVLRALGVPPGLAHSSLRFGVGRFTTEAEIDYVVDRLVAAAAHLRALGPRWELPGDAGTE